MTKIVKSVLRYSNCFKLRVVQEVSNGSSILDVRRRYGIKGGNTVQGWLKKYGREDLLTEIIHVKMRNETDRIKELELENKRLKIALADAVLARDALDSLVKAAGDHYQVDLKKNLGSRLSGSVTSSTVKK